MGEVAVAVNSVKENAAFRKYLSPGSLERAENIMDPLFEARQMSQLTTKTLICAASCSEAVYRNQRAATKIIVFVAEGCPGTSKRTEPGT